MSINVAIGRQSFHRCEYYLVNKAIQRNVMTPFEFSASLMLLWAIV
jgi:hypothetical protein